MSEHPIVIDLGSGYIKAGYTDGQEASAVFPSIVGKPRRRYMEQYESNPVFVGEEAAETRDHLSLYSPIDHGHIQDWNMLDEIWAYMFAGKFGFEPEETSILLSQPPRASRQHKYKMLETLFDTFNVPELTIQLQGTLALYAVAMTSGITVEIGEGVTQIVPISEGSLICEGVNRIDCGGQELTMYLQKLLCNNGYSFTTRDDFEFCRLIKETYCYVPLDPTSEEMNADLSVTFSLPDGYQLRDGTKEVTLGPERVYCPEALFNPTLIQKDHPPLHDLVLTGIGKCPIDLRSIMLENIILSGGCSLFKGLSERLRDTIAHVVPVTKQLLVKVHTPENGVQAVWQGGKVFCEMRAVHMDSWVSKRDFRECGDTVLERFRLY